MAYGGFGYGGGFGDRYGGWFGGPLTSFSSHYSGVTSRYWKPGEDFLQNTFHFPSFRDLPDENEIEDGYWEPDRYGVYQPACVWFFMGEIIYDETAQIPFLRNRVFVRDRDGGECPISFYPEDGFFDFKTLKKGSTVLVTNGQRHNFLDLTVGLRVGYLDNVAVVPCSMSDLLKLSNVYHTKTNTRCWSCSEKDISASASASSSASVSSSSGEGATAGSTELKKCAACRMATYCSKDCQKKDWKEGHKKTCKAVPLFKKLTQIDYMKVDDRSFLRRGI